MVIIMRLTKTTQLLTEKAKVRASVREQLSKHVEAKRDLFAKAEKVGNGIYEIPVHNADGTQTVYVRFEVKVSERSASDLAPKTRKPKAKGETEGFDIE
jgi:hypothetical protein